MLPYVPSGLQHGFQTGGTWGVWGKGGARTVGLENFWQLNVQFKKKKNPNNCESKCEISL